MNKRRFESLYSTPSVPWRLTLIIIVVAVLVSLLTSCMTTVHFGEDEYFSAVYEDTPGTQDQLYLKANQWMIKEFVDASSVIQHNDKEAGVVMGKFLLHGNLRTVGYSGSSVDTRIFAIIEITVKENKSRIQVKPQSSWTYSEESTNRYSKEDAMADIEKLATSFHKAMVKEVQDF